MRHSALLRTLATLILFALLFPVQALAQATIRVMTYNALNYLDSMGGTRNDDFQHVIEETLPMFLCMQEMQTDAAAAAFKTNVLDVIQPGLWSRGPNTLQDEYTDDTEIFYRSDLVTRLTTRMITTELRSIEWGAYQLHGGGAPVCTLLVAVAHPKAGNTTSDAEQRAREIGEFIDFLETNIPSQYAGQPSIICGDFNVYTSNEASYQELLDVYADPINKPGSWNNNSTFAAIHTQSTHSSGTILYSGGGLDDRFDQILVDSSFFDGEGLEVDIASYTAFGNDGQHYNKSINDLPLNTAVGDQTADALYYASDHLPVYVDFYHPLLSVGEGWRSALPAQWGLIDVYPNPFNAMATLRVSLDVSARYSVSLFNEMGQLVQSLGPFDGQPGVQIHSIRGQKLSSGFYFLTVSVEGQPTQTRRITLLK